jgi:hypothetical protein
VKHAINETESRLGSCAGGEVAKSKSFNKAAEELGISHPTVGLAVRRLEKAMNTELAAGRWKRW